ncbi:hypothetical protein GW17_00045803 [Ensete ventricosum]|nr:hypothetical protein GW17_00045803 [Ensete ventricosum]
MGPTSSPLRVASCDVRHSFSASARSPPHAADCPPEKETDAEMEEKPTEISSSKMFGGYNRQYRHFSPTLGCSMTFTVYFPPPSSPSQKFPVRAAVPPFL